MLHGLPLCPSGNAREELPPIGRPAEGPVSVARVHHAARRHRHELHRRRHRVDDLRSRCRCCRGNCCRRNRWPRSHRSRPPATKSCRLRYARLSGTELQPEIAVPLEVKLTVPVGSGPPGARTDRRGDGHHLPTVEGLGVLVTVVLVSSTTCNTVFEVLAREGPRALIDGAQVVDCRGAVRANSSKPRRRSRSAWPSQLASHLLLNTTVPVGVEPSCAVTVAVMVTAWPLVRRIGIVGQRRGRGNRRHRQLEDRAEVAGSAI